MKILLKFALLAAALVTGAANANTIPITVAGTVGGQPVDVTVSLVSSANLVTVTLNNLESDPISISQLISGLTFDVSGATGSGALATVNSGLITTVSAGGGFTTPVADALTHWKATGTGTSISLTTLSGGSPFDLIIGPPTYAHANPSITGKNPTVFESATFNITVPGVTGDSTFDNVVVTFGTAATTVNVSDGGTTITLLGLALLGLSAIRSRFAKT